GERLRRSSTRRRCRPRGATGYRRTREGGRMHGSSGGASGPVGFDFFGAGELPAPDLPIAEVAELVRTHWGLEVELAPLGSQQDQNFLAREGGTPVGVVKITNPAFTSIELEAQELATARIPAAA